MAGWNADTAAGPVWIVYADINPRTSVTGLPRAAEPPEKTAGSPVNCFLETTSYRAEGQACAGSFVNGE